VTHAHFRSLCTATLPLLRSLNGAEITRDEREAAEGEWRRLKRLYSMARNTLHARHAPLPLLHAMSIFDGPTDTGAGARDGARAGGSGASVTSAVTSAARHAAGAPAPAPAPAGARDGALSGTSSREIGSGERSPPAQLAAAFVDRVLEHALAVDEKISQLNTVWPHIVATYQARVHAEVVDRSLFLRRYQAAASGSDEGATLALPEMPAA
jgi:hypothetical protein